MEHGNVDEYWDEYDGSDEACPECGDGDVDMLGSACIDDLCHGGEVPCMHGYYGVLRCHLCGE